LSKLNAFDLVITVALGSVLATAILSKTTKIADDLTAIATLVLLQFIVTFGATRFKKPERLGLHPAVIHIFLLSNPYSGLPSLAGR
jgi:uncharacterized membrane protein YcaP (DUF421 family)